jgi:hypothetical protein
MAKLKEIKKFTTSKKLGKISKLQSLKGLSPLQIALFPFGSARSHRFSNILLMKVFRISGKGQPRASLLLEKG